MLASPTVMRMHLPGRGTMDTSVGVGSPKVVECASDSICITRKLVPPRASACIRGCGGQVEELGGWGRVGALLLWFEEEIQSTRADSRSCLPATHLAQQLAHISGVRAAQEVQGGLHIRVHLVIACTQGVGMRCVRAHALEAVPVVQAMKAVTQGTRY